MNPNRNLFAASTIALAAGVLVSLSIQRSSIATPATNLPTLGKGTYEVLLNGQREWIVDPAIVKIGDVTFLRGEGIMGSIGTLRYISLEHVVTLVKRDDVNKGMPGAMPNGIPKE